MTWAIFDRVIMVFSSFSWLVAAWALYANAPHEMVRSTRLLFMVSVLPAAYAVLRLLFGAAPASLAEELTAALVFMVVLGAGALLYWVRRVWGEFERVKRMAHTDFLTGLSNRLGLEEAFHSGVLTRKGGHYAVLQMDVDGFKAVNDLRGHVYGDRMLQAISTVLFEEFRDDDILARMGGDEFLGIVFCAGPDDAFALGHRLKGRVEELGKADALGLSVGIAVHPDDGKTFLELQRVADVRMYQDKQSRRARYVHQGH